LNEIKFSGKDELMGNLRAAALACGVVASVLGGGIGVGYLTSSTVSTADIVSEDNTKTVNVNSVIASKSVENSTVTENATANKRTTTKKSYTVEKSTAASKNTGAAQEGTTSLYGIEVATTAAQISRSVPAPAHAPAAITQPATQASTTAAIVARATEAVKVTTAKPVVTTTLMTTTTTATTTTTMVETTIAAEEYVEPTTEAPQETTETYVEPETEPVVIDVETEEDSLPITDEEYILLCNAVAHEAGCNWISTEDKAKVVEVIMNRVSSPKFPNTIYGVITQPYQFSGSSTYANLNTYSSHVTQSVKDAVTLYFKENGSFTQGYIGFWGDGYSNHFY
jgi:hypothetical protein